MEQALVILLHGVGSNGANIAPLGEALAGQLPGLRCVAPNAPHAFPMPGGFQWFSLDGITPANRLERVTGARTAFDALLSKIIAEEGFADDLDRVVLVGFSQGSIMALDAVARGRWPVGAVVAFSGRLATPISPKAAIDTPVLLIHGADDAVIPASESESAMGRLDEAGFDTAIRILPGLDHGISVEGVAIITAFLEEILD